MPKLCNGSRALQVFISCRIGDHRRVRRTRYAVLHQPLNMRHAARASQQKSERRVHWHSMTLSTPSHRGETCWTEHLCDASSIARRSVNVSPLQAITAVSTARDAWPCRPRCMQPRHAAMTAFGREPPSRRAGREFYIWPSSPNQRLQTASCQLLASSLGRRIYCLGFLNRAYSVTAFVPVRAATLRSIARPRWLKLNSAWWLQGYASAKASQV